jgi:dolichyl-phosphate-mannose-protein mannosyltransferase
MAQSPRHSPTLVFIAAALLLAFQFWLALGSVREKSPTFDEGYYIVRGWAALRTGHVLPLGHPPLANLISGLGVMLEPGLPDPATLDGWQQDDAERASRDLLWHRGLDASRTVWLARLPMIFLGLMLSALIARWARELYGRRAMILALGLMAFSPTILAHTQLATTDMCVAAFYIAALYTWSRALHRMTWRRLVITGVLFGLAQASKFSALLLIPTMGLMALWMAWRGAILLPPSIPIRSQVNAGRPLRLAFAVAASLMMGLIGAVVVWAISGFSLDLVAKGSYLGELQHFLELASGGHRAYMLGQFSQSGWLVYHPLTLLVKLTLPEWAAILAALVMIVFGGLHHREWEVLFPALVYLAISIAGTLNVGIRYLLPVIPLLFLFSARIAAGSFFKGRRRLAATGLIIAAQAIVSILGYPHYLAYFNEIAGGRDNGYKWLVDSNLDWGQDLPGLANYLKQRGIGKIYLSYFGQADPAYYGIDYFPLPAWPLPSPKPAYYPLNPAPGIYAISASNLVGVPQWPYEWDSFAYFRAREPVARIGASIFIYEVPAEMKPPEWVVQCAAPEGSEQLDTVQKLMGVDGLVQFYFDCRQSLPIPEGPGWVILPPGIEPVVDLGPPHFEARFEDGSPRYRAWYLAEAPMPPDSTIIAPALSLPVPVADHLELLGYQISSSEAAAGDTLTATVWWRVRQPPQPPVSIFAHLVPSGDEGVLPPVAIGDTLGVRAEDWRPGMILIQQHVLAISPDAPTGDYVLEVGLYSLVTGSRFPVAETPDRVIDRILLSTIRVNAATR